MKHFQVQTKRSADSTWRVAIDARARADGVLHAFAPTRAMNNVRLIRFVMLSNHGDPAFMDVLEVTVRGA